MEENRNEELSKEAAETETTETAAEEQAATEDTREAAAEPEEKDDASSEDEDSKKKGFFGKKKKDKKDTQIEELTDRVQRQMAEFDNFRKRTEKEKAAMCEVGERDRKASADGRQF